MVTPVQGKDHLVIKRNGQAEPYSRDKLYAVILWACNGSTAFADQLIEAVNIKIHNRISIIKLYDEVISTASNLISDLYPQWEQIAKNLYELKLHKDVGVLRDFYPSYQSIVDLNTEFGYYSQELLNCIDIPAIEAAINPAYDKLFTFGGLNLFVDKYCNKYKGRLLELPQHVYMRVAIQLCHNSGTKAIIDKYHQLASHLVTEATPKVVNSLRPRPQMFSCCLARPTDSLESINSTADLLSRESKYSGGLATDISALRAAGSHIDGNMGSSGGVKPFIKGYQELIGSYNQGNTRSSSLAVYFNWFHYQSPEIAEMKLESGKDEDRARKLKYAVKWTPQLSRAIINNDDVYLFDPHKCQDMTFAHGPELDSLMSKYSKSSHIRKRKYSARDLAFTFAKTRVETGNLYIFFTDNANSQNIGSGVVTQANLCMEYTPSFSSIDHINDSLLTSGIMTRSYTGDIALCNLAAFNLEKWYYLSRSDKAEQAYILVRSMDNAIDVSFYANLIGQHHSQQHRNIGVGFSNYASLLASHQLRWDTPEARKFTHEMMEELSYYTIAASIRLAKERGAYPLYKQSRWAQGLFPHELSILHNSDSPLNYPLLMPWNTLRASLKEYGIRNEYLLAPPPTATSGKAINATEGADVPRKLKTIQEGTYSLPFVVPNLKQNRDYYQTTFEVANKDTIELAAIRQKFIDMSQSVSLAYATPDSAYEVISDIIYAEKLGLKSLYYAHIAKASDLTSDTCESCSS